MGWWLPTIAATSGVVAVASGTVTGGMTLDAAEPGVPDESGAPDEL
jgi:hypothetical protein